MSRVRKVVFMAIIVLPPVLGCFSGRGAVKHDFNRLLVPVGTAELPRPNPIAAPSVGGGANRPS